MIYDRDFNFPFLCEPNDQFSSEADSDSKYEYTKSNWSRKSNDDESFEKVL